MKWLLNNKLVIVGIIVGSVAGFFYWKQVGCTSGTCMITSKWHNSTGYGALMGGLLFSIFQKPVRKDKETKSSENE
jgi:LytS/YehU family sensor histidine kinase